MNPVRISFLVLLAMLLMACSGQEGTSQGDGGPDEYSAGADGMGAGGSGDDSLGAGSRFGGDDGMGGDAQMFGPDAPVENRVVFFAYDQSDVSEKYRELLSQHGAYLAENPAVRVRLEGHGDEKGSREYNIGLGERRAQAVRQYLLLQGVSAAQLSTVSYGEERPSVLGSDEEAWALNRRVELVYSR